MDTTTNKRFADRYRIESIPNSTAQSLVVEHHYLHRKAPCSAAFGLIDTDGSVVGVVMYGTPSSAPLRRGVCGSDEALNVAELTRLWIAEGVPANAASFLVGNTITHCGKDIVVSYADTSQGHVGYVYQATNWLYTGLSAKRTNWTVDGIDKHCQTLADKYTADEIREQFGDRFSLQPRPRKHRYVYFCGSKGRRKALLAKLRYPLQPYPKG